MNQKEALTIFRTVVTNCPACQAKGLHSTVEIAMHHPYSGHGYDRRQWSHRALEEEARAREEKKS